MIDHYANCEHNQKGNEEYFLHFVNLHNIFFLIKVYADMTVHGQRPVVDLLLPRVCKKKEIIQHRDLQAQKLTEIAQVLFNLVYVLGRILDDSVYLGPVEENQLSHGRH